MYELTRQAGHVSIVIITVRLEIRCSDVQCIYSVDLYYDELCTRSLKTFPACYILMCFHQHKKHDKHTCTYRHSQLLHTLCPTVVIQ